MELEQLDATIRNADGEMKVMTQAYEKSVQDRNGVGLMVIDRNDELSILYQKFNGQEDAIKRGRHCLFVMDLRSSSWSSYVCKHADSAAILCLVHLLMVWLALERTHSGSCTPVKCFALAFHSWWQC